MPLWVSFCLYNVFSFDTCIPSARLAEAPFRQYQYNIIIIIIIIVIIVIIIIIIKQAPGWLKRPSGATFGFGGQLATFNKKVAPDGNPGVASVQV